MVKWIHKFHDEPTTMYYEIDCNSVELRKIELYKNGLVGYADDKCQINGSRLSEGKFPSFEEIKKQEEFIPVEITKEDFEKVYNSKVNGILI